MIFCVIFLFILCLLLLKITYSLWKKTNEDRLHLNNRCDFLSRRIEDIEKLLNTVEWMKTTSTSRVWLTTATEHNVLRKELSDLALELGYEIRYTGVQEPFTWVKKGKS